MKSFTATIAAKLGVCIALMLLSSTFVFSQDRPLMPHLVQDVGFTSHGNFSSQLPTDTSIATSSFSVSAFDFSNPRVVSAAIDTAYCISEYDAFAVVGHSGEIAQSQWTGTVDVRFTSPHNVEHVGTLVVVIRYTVEGSDEVLRIAGATSLRGRVELPVSHEFAFTNNIADVALFDTLRTYVKGHTPIVGGYNRARDIMFEELDIYQPDSLIRCVYTDSVVKAFGRTDAFQNQNFNTEHIWPQSHGARSNTPPGYDLYNMTITEEKINNERASFPFDNVEGEGNCRFCGGAGSKFGFNNQGERVFEPRDAVKGDIARSVLYFQLRYGDNSNTFGFNFPNYEQTLREWTHLDPVNDSDAVRNTRVGEIQGRENPFISYPPLLDRIHTLSNERTPTPQQSFVTAAMPELYYKNRLADGWVIFYTVLINKGNKKANVVLRSSKNLIAAFHGYTIEPFSYDRVSWGGSGDALLEPGVDTLFITTDDSVTTTVPIHYGNIRYVSVEEPQVNTCNIMLQIAPVPAFDKAVARITLPDNTTMSSTFRIFNSMGIVVADLSAAVRGMSGEQVEVALPAHLPSGVYFAKLHAGSCTTVEKVVIQR